MTGNLQTVLQIVEKLSPNEQLELIATVSRALQQQYPPLPEAIPAAVQRTSPLHDLAYLKANFWPEEETADEINAYLQQQRQDDLLRESNEHRTA